MNEGTGSPSAIRVLWIGGNSSDADLLEALLATVSKPSREVQVVSRLQEGLACLARRRVDLVLLNLTLPDSHGPETAAKVHAQDPSVPIVVLPS